MTEKAPDIKAKLELLRGDLFNLQEANRTIVVRWLSRKHTQDPALASLGLGLHTITVARAKDVEFDGVTFTARSQGPSATAMSQIAADDIIDIKIVGPGKVTDDEIRAFVGQDKAPKS